MRSVPGAVATGLKFGDLDRRVGCDPVATAPGTDSIIVVGRVLDGTKICRLYFSIALLEAWFQAHPDAQPSC